MTYYNAFVIHSFPVSGMTVYLLYTTIVQYVKKFNLPNYKIFGKKSKNSYKLTKSIAYHWKKV